ncbi:hypothetical protein ScPMuIL_008544 [Solemya velum]
MSPESKVFKEGLDSAGKTTLLYRLKLGEIIATIPTIGFNVESIQYKDITFTAWTLAAEIKFDHYSAIITRVLMQL